MALFVVLTTLYGLAIGSFLNVVIVRIPDKQSILRPASSCPSCHHLIGARDNIPLLSWLLLRGKCRHCGARISPRYPLIEGVTAALFGFTAWHFGFSWPVPTFLIVFSGLIALAATDLERLLLPKRIVYPVLLAEVISLVVATFASHRWHDLAVATVSGAVWFAAFFLLNFASPRLLGFGDVRLAPVLGLALGWLGVGYVFLGFFLANLIGAIIGLGLIATKKITREHRIPYGVFLAAGTIAAVFLGPVLHGRVRGF